MQKNQLNHNPTANKKQAQTKKPTQPTTQKKCYTKNPQPRKEQKTSDEHHLSFFMEFPKESSYILKLQNKALLL